MGPILPPVCNNFGSSPASLLVLGIIYLALQLRQKDRKLIELNTASIKVLKDLHSGLLLLHEKIDHLKEMTNGKKPK